MNKPILISIDHGNRNIKAIGENKSTCFTSGFVESSIEPIVKENLLQYEGKYYSIGSNRFPVIYNKSENDKFFVLTLAAIAEVLEKPSNDTINIVLACGLPISNFSFLKKEFKSYFIREVEFDYLGVKWKINIKNVYIYPQAYSAMISVFNNFRGYSLLCCDLGGYTIDLCKVDKGGKLDISSATSINNGIILLLKDIQQELLRQNIRLSEEQIEDVIKDSNSPALFNEQIINLIDYKVQNYTNALLDELSEKTDIKVNPVLFIGGGAILLEKIIKQSSKTNYFEVLDQYANCRGYKLLAIKELSKIGY